MAGSFQDRRVQERVAGAVGEFHEAEALFGVEPLDGRVERGTARCRILPRCAPERLLRRGPNRRGFIVIISAPALSPVSSSTHCSLAQPSDGAADALPLGGGGGGEGRGGEGEGEGGGGGEARVWEDEGQGRGSIDTVILRLAHRLSKRQRPPNDRTSTCVNRDETPITLLHTSAAIFARLRLPRHF